MNGISSHTKWTTRAGARGRGGGGCLEWTEMRSGTCYLRGADVSSGGGRSRHRHCGVGAQTGRLTVPSWPLVTPVINNSPQTHWTNVDCVRRTTGETLLTFWDATVNLYNLSCVILTSWPVTQPQRNQEAWPKKQGACQTNACHLLPAAAT